MSDTEAAAQQQEVPTTSSIEASRGESYWREFHDKGLSLIDGMLEVMHKQSSNFLTSYFTHMQNLIAVQGEELIHYHRLESHIINQTMTEEILQEILTKLREFRARIHAEQTALKASALPAAKQ